MVYVKIFSAQRLNYQSQDRQYKDQVNVIDLQNFNEFNL